MSQIPKNAGPPATTQVWTIVVAAGTGTRFGGAIPKQFVEVAGRRVVDWSIRAASAVSDGIVVVVPPQTQLCTGDFVDAANGDATLVCATGGASRSESVRAGLAHVPEDATTVLVHDAARPVASAALFARVAAAIHEGAEAAIPVVAVVDTVRDSQGNPVDRATLQAVQTPQGFAADALRLAHANQSDATDDASLVQASGGKVVTVPGERWNIKVTDPTDDRVVAALLEAQV